MNKFKINENKVTIRNLLNIQHHFEDYPTIDDFLYDLVKVLEEHDLLEKTWKVPEIASDLNKLPKGNSYAKMMDKLVEEGYVEKQKEGTISFKLIKHPWV